MNGPGQGPGPSPAASDAGEAERRLTVPDREAPRQAGRPDAADPGTLDGPPPCGLPGPARRHLRTSMTVVVLAGSLVFLVRSFTSGPTGITEAVRRVGPWLAVAEIPVLVGLWVAALAWRAPLQRLSGPLGTADAVRIFAVGQLGKYIPGVMWSILLQARLARAARITTAQLAAAFGVYAAVAVATGTALGLPAAVPRAAGTLPALLAVLGSAAALATAPTLLGLAIGLVRRVPVIHRRLAPVPRATLRDSLILSTGSWLLSGTHLWLLAVALGAHWRAAVIPCLGGFALSTALSSLVVVVPDGIGVRESVLALALTSCLPPPEAAVAALASRLLLATGDLLAFGYGSWAGRRLHRTGPRPRGRLPHPTTGDLP
jgi:glycosyltransferase 2 family protein